VEWHDFGIVLLWQGVSSAYTGGFLATPVWAALDVAAAPAVGYARAAAQRGLSRQMPLLGVMGRVCLCRADDQFFRWAGDERAFSGGRRCSLYTLRARGGGRGADRDPEGAGAVFQDGGVLALGRERHEHGGCGHAGGYLPFSPVGTGPAGAGAMFFGGFLSVLASAVLGARELLFSGVTMPAPVWECRSVVCRVGGARRRDHACHNAALVSINPDFIRKPQLNAAACWLGGAGGIGAGVVGVAVLPRSGWNLELAGEAGIASHAKALLAAPLADYQLDCCSRRGCARRAGLGRAGVDYGACMLCGKLLAPREARKCTTSCWTLEPRASAIHRRDARAKTWPRCISDALATARRNFPAWALLLRGFWRREIAARLPILAALARATVVLPFTLVFAAISLAAGEPLAAITLVGKSYLSAGGAGAAVHYARCRSCCTASSIGGPRYR